MRNGSRLRSAPSPKARAQAEREQARPGVHGAREGPPQEKVWARGDVVKPAVSRSPWGRTGGSSLCVVRVQPHSPVLSSISPGRSTPKIFFRGKCSLTRTQKAENYRVQIGSGLTAQTHSTWCASRTDSSPSGRALSSGLPGTAGADGGDRKVLNKVASGDTCLCRGHSLPSV